MLFGPLVIKYLRSIQDRKPLFFLTLPSTSPPFCLPELHSSSFLSLLLLIYLTFPSQFLPQLLPLFLLHQLKIFISDLNSHILYPHILLSPWLSITCICWWLSNVCLYPTTLLWTFDSYPVVYLISPLRYFIGIANWTSHNWTLDLIFPLDFHIPAPFQSYFSYNFPSPGNGISIYLDVQTETWK